MAEVSIGGISFKGGKMMAIILALSSAVGALYGGFEVYKRFQDMSAAIEAYQEPDLSGFDKKIALVESNITEIVNDVEDRQKEDSRELIDEMKLLEESLDLKIDKALNNPLSGMSAKN